MPRKDRRLKLGKALQIGYLRDERKQAKALGRFGYMLDNRLSDGRQTLVAFNPKENQVLFVANGTDPKSSKDLETDLLTITGGLKQTRRYDETKAAYNAAKQKYKGAQFVDVGHSLAGGLVNAVASGNDTVYTYNAAFAPNQKARANVQNYRTAGDVVSLFAPKETTTQLVNRTESTVRPVNYLLKTHAVENIKDLPVYL